jgi:hypothetical protein
VAKRFGKAGGHAKFLEEYAPHMDIVRKAGAAGNGFEWQSEICQQIDRALKPAILNELLRAEPHFLLEHAGKMPLTHHRPLCQIRYRKALVQIIQNPVLQFPDIGACGALGQQVGTELRLATRTLQEHHHFGGHFQREITAEILFHQASARSIPAVARRSPDIVGADEDGIGLYFHGRKFSLKTVCMAPMGGGALPSNTPAAARKNARNTMMPGV